MAVYILVLVALTATAASRHQKQPLFYDVVQQHMQQAQFCAKWLKCAVSAEAAAEVYLTTNAVATGAWCVAAIKRMETGPPRAAALPQWSNLST